MVVKLAAYAYGFDSIVWHQSRDIANEESVPVADFVPVTRVGPVHFVVDKAQAEISPDPAAVVEGEFRIELVDGGFLVMKVSKDPLGTEIRLFEDTIRIAAGEGNRPTADHGGGGARAVRDELDDVGYLGAVVYDVGSNSLTAEGGSFIDSAVRVIAAGGRIAMGRVEIQRQQVIDLIVDIEAERGQLVSQLEQAIPERELLARLAEVAAAAGHERLGYPVREAEDRVVIEDDKIEIADPEG